MTINRTINRTLTARHTWLTPVLLIIGLAVALPAIYLASTSDPQGHLSGLPVALVVEDPTTGAVVADAVAAAADDELAFHRMTDAELDDAMHDDEVAGAVVVPADLSEPVSVLANAGRGGINTALLYGNVTPLLHAVAARAGGFEITTGPYVSLPEDSGLGTSAFYYALILVLLGFIGASLVGPLVDSALGFLPSELGPLVARAKYTAVSRRATYLAKVAVLVAAAPLAALVVQLVAGLVGVSSSSPVALWAFSTAAIAAIGTSALAVLAVFGAGIGSLVNTLFFVALSMVSSGGTVPLEAAPLFFERFSAIAPFHHVVAGTRSILYYDANPGAGLGSAWIAVVLGGVLGMLLGLVVTSLYGRVARFSRHPQ